MANELKLPRSVVQALNSLVSECLEAGRLGSYDAANIARRNLEKELTAWNTRADTARLSELEAALREQIAAHALLCKAAGLDEQAHLDGTAQARAALRS